MDIGTRRSESATIGRTAPGLHMTLTFGSVPGLPEARGQSIGSGYGRAVDAAQSVPRPAARTVALALG